MTSENRDGRGHDCGDDARADKRLIHDQLRQAATDLATAQLLERRADGSASPALAECLRERARVRRLRAARLRRIASTPRSRA